MKVEDRSQQQRPIEGFEEGATTIVVNAGEGADQLRSQL